MITRQELQEKELDLWRKWRGGKKDALPDLFKSFRPVENSWYNKLPANNMPESAVRGEIKKNMYDAFKKYNPSRGTKLSTYVNTQLQKTYRYVSERQNIGRIPEHRALRIGTYTTTKDQLSDTLGREPNTFEMADELAWAPKEVERMEKDLRRDILLTPEIEDSFSFHDTSQKQQILTMVYYELTPRERKVFEWSTGHAGKRMLANKDIAKKLRVSVPTVGNIKKKIAGKIERYMR